MPIKIAKQAKIDEEFVEELKDIALARAHTMQRQVERADPRMRDALLKQYGPHISRIARLFDPKASGRSGLDYELTRLKQLRYQWYRVIEYEGTRYLCGVTTPVTAVELIPENRQGQTPRTWDIGRYIIAFPVRDLKSATVDGLHLIPERAPKTYHRHFHHHGSEHDARSPFDHKPATCWGSFGGIVVDDAQCGDIPDLFRNMRFYVERVDMDSLYVRISNLEEAGVIA